MELRELTEQIGKRDREALLRSGEDSLRLDIEQIQHAIQKTRYEIVTLRADKEAESFSRATDELDAVVSDTESATDTILSAAERIDEAAARISKHVSEEHQGEIAAIQDQVIRIFEACNFQDITGQRISKVVRLLHFVEERIEHMIEIWGVDDDKQPEGASAFGQRTGDEALLNGPALITDKDVVSQDDIDSLFS